MSFQFVQRLLQIRQFPLLDRWEKNEKRTLTVRRRRKIRREGGDQKNQCGLGGVGGEDYFFNLFLF